MNLVIYYVSNISKKIKCIHIIMNILIIIAKMKSWKSSIIFKYNKHINYYRYVNFHYHCSEFFYLLVYFNSLQNSWI